MISGSAGDSCSEDSLDTAIRFVQSFTREILRTGGGVVVLAGDEDSTMDERGAVHIFDWVALREVERYAETTSEQPRICARIIMSDAAPKSKISDANLRLLKNLEQRKVVELRRIRGKLFTGGAYRKEMAESADAMLAIGGGKGAYSSGTQMMESGKPVLPLDLRLGSTADDGEGAVALHREMMANPNRFFPYTHSEVTNSLTLLSFNRKINEAEVLDRELKASPSGKPRSRAGKFLTNSWKAAQNLPIISAAIKILDFVRGFFAFP